MARFDGQVAVVTGAASGIGLALAGELAVRGASVVLADVDDEALDLATRAVIQAGGRPALGVTTDVTQPEQLAALRDAAVEAFGTVHLVCANAGVGGRMGASWELGDDEWDAVLDVNLHGVRRTVATFVPLLVEQDAGHVLLTSSMAGLLPLPFGGPYTASKHAVVGLGDALRLELTLRRAKVGVTVLCPGWTRTRIGDTGGLAVSDPDDHAAVTMAEGVAELIDGGVAPIEVACKALDAVAAGRFWALTHPDQAAAVLPWYGEAVASAGLPLPEMPGLGDAETSPAG